MNVALPNAKVSVRKGKNNVDPLSPVYRTDIADETGIIEFALPFGCYTFYSDSTFPNTTTNAWDPDYFWVCLNGTNVQTNRPLDPSLVLWPAQLNPPMFRIKLTWGRPTDSPDMDLDMIVQYSSDATSQGVCETQVHTSASCNSLSFTGLEQGSIAASAVQFQLQQRVYVVVVEHTTLLSDQQIALFGGPRVTLTQSGQELGTVETEDVVPGAVERPTEAINKFLDDPTSLNVFERIALGKWQNYRYWHVACIDARGDYPIIYALKSVFQRYLPENPEETGCGSFIDNRDFKKIEGSLRTVP